MKAPLLLITVSAAFLFPMQANAAVISMDENEAFGEPSPTEILNDHRKKLNRNYSLEIPGVPSSRPGPIHNGVWDNKNPQAYDWFQAGNTLSPDQKTKLATLGTPVPEPTGTVLLGFAGLAFALRRKR